MSDGSLSQDEIDALLQETDNLEIETGAAGGADLLGDQEKKQILDLMEASVANQASNLSILTRKNVSLEKPTLELASREAIIQSLPEQVVDVKIGFTDDLKGEHSYILDVDTARTLAGLMMGQAGVELDDAALSAVAEAVSQVSGSVTTEISNQLAKTIKNSPPEYQMVPRAKVRFPQGDMIVRLHYPLMIEGEAPSTLIELYSVTLMKEIAGLLGGGKAAVQAAALGANPAPLAGPAPAAVMPGMQAGLRQTFGQPIGGLSFGTPQAPPNVQPVQFANLQTSAPAGEQGNISLLMDVYMEMTVELGRTRKTIREILGIGEGTIIELDKLAGEPVDILVNHKLIAKGEVVVIDENFGVRVTEIVSPMERMSELT